MNAHQPHDIDVFRMRRRQRLVGLPGDELRQPRDEVVQGQRAGLVEPAGLLDELVQIGQLPRTEEFAQENGVVAGAGEDFLQQMRNRDAVLQGAKRGERLGGEASPPRCSAPNSAGGRSANSPPARPSGRRLSQ